MPWFHPTLDPDIEQALQRWLPEPARVLDLGTGPGTQAIELARRGYRVIGTDVSHSAIREATSRAARSGVKVDFRVDDVRSTALTERFDLVIDRGCFHVFEPHLRPAHAETIAAWLEPGGLLFLKCFSHLQQGPGGKTGLHPDELGTCFGADFEILSMDHCVYQGNNNPLPKALFCVFRRIGAVAGGQ